MCACVCEREGACACIQLNHIVNGFTTHFEFVIKVVKRQMDVEENFICSVVPTIESFLKLIKNKTVERDVH